uniref:NADH-ubiquinone oxidoreductase chain 6 n=1 Tax=Fergusonina taylori TaxID=991131 RepID=H6TDN5_9MUSC|nr:NADH dehydrogenase subunit 6 [Fergusonina taylori]ADY86001.1 NADH dehydrogenase subunit 6 [Fergusonina taylori]
MMQLLFWLNMIISSFIFYSMNHPMAMGLTLMIQTMLTCCMTGLISKTFWFSYILFLIFLGGMLILFIYMTSIASNEMFSLSNKMFMNYVIWFLMNLLIILMIDKPLFMMNLHNIEMMNNCDDLSFMPENFLMLNKLYNFPTNLINIMLMNYLLMTLVATIKITNIFYGPLRKMT